MHSDNRICSFPYYVLHALDRNVQALWSQAICRLRWSISPLKVSTEDDRLMFRPRTAHFSTCGDRFDLFKPRVSYLWDSDSPEKQEQKQVGYGIVKEWQVERGTENG